MNPKYTQCELVKDGITHSIAWIPSKFAVKNKILRIKTSHDTWAGGWMVTNVYKTVDLEYLNDHYLMYKDFRDVLSDH